MQVDVESLNGSWVNIRKSIVEMEDKLGVFEQRIREDNIKMEVRSNLIERTWGEMLE